MCNSEPIFLKACYFNRINLEFLSIFFRNIVISISRLTEIVQENIKFRCLVEYYNRNFQIGNRNCIVHKPVLNVNILQYQLIDQKMNRKRKKISHGKQTCQNSSIQAKHTQNAKFIYFSQQNQNYLHQEQQNGIAEENLDLTHKIKKIMSPENIIAKKTLDFYQHQFSNNLLENTTANTQQAYNIKPDIEKYNQFAQFNDQQSTRPSTEFQFESDNGNHIETFNLDNSGIFSHQSSIGHKTENSQIMQEEALQIYFKEIQKEQLCESRIDLKRTSFIQYKRKDIEQEYQLLQKLGQGSFGTVYKCLHRLSKVTRSVKIIKNQKQNAKNNRQALKKQIQILKKLDHPHIIKIFQVFEHKQIVYIVCQYCQGGTLKSFINKKDVFSVEFKQKVMLQIFQAVNYMHQMGIVHRDIKPDNILFVNKLIIDSSIDQVDIRIIDFGLSIQSSEKYFKDWSKIGSLAFMAPEAFKGIYSTKCDSWSCGVIMHILFLGYNPYAESEDYLILQKIQNYNLDKNKNWSLLSKDLQDLLLLLLEHNYILRAEMVQILNHSHFKVQKPNQQQQKNNNLILQRLLSHQRSKNIVDFMKYYLTFNTISQQKIKQLGEYFNIMDQDKNGLIDQREFQRFLTNQSIKQELTQNVFSSLNLDKSGRINFGQFVCGCSNKKQLFTIENINQIFKQIDTTRDKQIDLIELKRFLVGFDKQKVQYLMEEITGNKNGRIKPEQFLWYMLDNVYFE